jgi:hypothetical protein
MFKNNAGWAIFGGAIATIGLVGGGVFGVANALQMDPTSSVTGVQGVATEKTRSEQPRPVAAPIAPPIAAAAPVAVVAPADPVVIAPAAPAPAPAAAPAPAPAANDSAQVGSRDGDNCDDSQDGARSGGGDGSFARSSSDGGDFDRDGSNGGDGFRSDDNR